MDPGGQHGLREFGVLGQEAEPRVERVGTDGPCGRDDRADVEQVECVGTVGPRKDRPDPEPVAGPGDPVRDLAAVGDEEGPDRHDGERLGPLRCDKRVNRVRRDTPTAANTTCGQPTRRDPALNRPCRRPDTRGSLTRAQFLGHDCRDRRIDGSMSSDDPWPAAVACGGGLWWWPAVVVSTVGRQPRSEAAQRASRTPIVDSQAPKSRVQPSSEVLDPSLSTPSRHRAPGAIAAALSAAAAPTLLPAGCGMRAVARGWPAAVVSTVGRQPRVQAALNDSPDTDRRLPGAKVACPGLIRGLLDPSLSTSSRQRAPGAISAAAPVAAGGGGGLRPRRHRRP